MSFVEKNSITKMFKIITDTLVERLDIDRASYWKIEDQKLKCVNLFDRNELDYLSHIDIDQHLLPIYFQALVDGIAIVADDLITNEYSQELNDSCLITWPLLKNN